MLDATGVSVAEAGVDYPVDLAQARAWFRDDAACADYLAWLRWPDGFRCPRCGCGDALFEPRGRFRCRSCRTRTSVTVGTVFEKTRIPLTVWFEAAWLMTTNKGGISAAYLHRVLPIASYPTAWTMLAKLRQAMSQAGGTLLTGRVEVDETFIGGPRPGAPGRGAAGKTLVAGAIEIDADGWGRARLKIIPDASMASLRDFVTATIAVGTTVVSDGWPSYPGALKGYVHEPVNVSASGRPAHEALPAVHRVFALVKRMIEGTYQGSGSAGHLQEYLDEFVFRFNRRRSKSRGLVFMRLLQRAVGQEATTFRDLVRDSKPKPMAPSGKPGQHARPGTLDATEQPRPWRGQG